MTEGKIVVCPQCGKKYKLKVGFNAASFSCNACSATVWVKKKSAAAPTSARTRRPAGRAAASAGRRKAAGGRGRAPARGRRRQEEPAQDEGGSYSSRYGGKKDNSATVIMAIVGVVVIGVIIFFAASSGGDKPEQTANVPPVPDTDGCGETDVDTGTADGVGDDDIDLSGGKTGPAKVTDDPAKGDTDGDAKPTADTTPAKKLGDGKRKRAGANRKSRWDPPAGLGHLEGTSPGERKQIDDFITTMIDVDAGRDSLDAKEALIAIGKPAFPRILGAMAKIRDTITDVDSDDERLIESSLKLADECLREMDGWLTAKGKSSLRPGSEKRYIGYICRLHYKRWMQKLKDMPEMPGPYDPSGEYGGDAPEEYK